MPTVHWNTHVRLCRAAKKPSKKDALDILLIAGHYKITLNLSRQWQNSDKSWRLCADYTPSTSCWGCASPAVAKGEIPDDWPSPRRQLAVGNISCWLTKWFFRHSFPAFHRFTNGSCQVEASETPPWLWRPRPNSHTTRHFQHDRQNCSKGAYSLFTCRAWRWPKQ